MGKSNGKRNLWVVDTLASNNGSDVDVVDTMAYSAPFAITGGTQLVYRDWVLQQLSAGTAAYIVLDKTIDSLLAAGQPKTFFINISIYTQFNSSADIITLSPDGTGKPNRWFDMPIINQDTNNNGTGGFTGWNVTGHSNDGTTLSEDLIIIISSGGSASTPSGSASGDLSGTYPAPSVAKFNGQLPSYYLNYANLTGKPTDLGNFTNNPGYALIDGTNTLRTAANPGHTTSQADIGHWVDPGISDNTYSVQAWFYIKAQTGSATVKLQISFVYNAITWTKDLSMAESALDYYVLGSLNFRITSGTTITGSAVVAGSGTITYECGITIELKK